MIEFICKAILFDLDGVLVDSTACIERRWQRWAEKHNLDFEAIMRVSHGRRTEDTMRLVAPHLVAEEEAARLAESEAVDTEGVYEIEGAAQLLKTLSGRTWAIVTSGPIKTATARLMKTGLPIPPVLVTAGDVKEGKPNPEPYLVAAARLGLSPADCLVVEDAPAGIQAGRSAGMPVIAVATTHSIDELTLAQAIVTRLADIEISDSLNQSAHGLTVRVNSAWIRPVPLPSPNQV